jgi:hypothetical protein
MHPTHCDFFNVTYSLLSVCAISPGLDASPECVPDDVRGL